MGNDNYARFNLLLLDSQKYINDIILFWLRPCRMNFLKQNIHLIKNSFKSSFSTTKPINHQKHYSFPIGPQLHSQAPLNGFPKAIQKITPVVSVVDFLVRLTTTPQEAD